MCSGGTVLPTGFLHTWDETLVSHFSQADPADSELAIIAPRATAKLASIPVLDFEFRSSERLEELRFRGHVG